MAFTFNIKETEYQKIDGKDHLFYHICICQIDTHWENTVKLRYSSLKYLHRKLTLSLHLFKCKPLPKFPTWVRISALFTNKMDEKTIETRSKRIEEYLELLSEHLVARSTPYFEQTFELPTEVIVSWINYYDGFEGVRRLQNRHIRLSTHTFNEEGVQANFDDDRDIGEADFISKKKTNSKITMKDFLKTMEKNPPEKSEHSQSGSRSQSHEESKNMEHKKLYNPPEIDTKNSISLFNAEKEHNEEIKQIQEAPKNQYDKNSEETQKLKEEIERRDREMEELKKEILKKSESSNKSLKTYDQPVEKITENNDLKNQSSMKNLSNVMLANIFLKRTKQIPKQALEKRQKERDLNRKNEEEIARRREEEIALIKQNLKHKDIHYGDRGKTERRKFASKHHEVEVEEEYEEEEIEYEEEEEEEVEVIDDIRSKSSGVFSGYD